MKFKTKLTEEEFNDSRLKTDALLMVLAIDGYVQWKHGLELEITDVYYQRGEFNSETAVHEEWRGIDAVIRGATKEINNDVKDWTNKNFMLPAQGMSPCIIHDAGTGDHLHIQTSRLGRITVPRLN